MGDASLLSATAAAARPLRLVIADDHELVRRGLRMVFESEPGLLVAAEAATCEQALLRAVEFAPDVLLLDLRMPGIGSAEVCREVVARCPGTRVIVLSTFDDDADVQAMMDAGASGYLLKDVAPDALARSIRGVADGAVVMNPSIAQRFVRPRMAHDAAVSEEALSERELEVLRCLARGMKNRDIAREMWISESTVKTHVGRIIHKLGQRDRTQAVLVAIKSGLVTLDA